jgi:hypothetical protein
VSQGNEGPSLIADGSAAGSPIHQVSLGYRGLGIAPSIPRIFISAIFNLHLSFLPTAAPPTRPTRSASAPVFPQS